MDPLATPHDAPSLKVSLRILLEQTGGLFVVPSYQRRYVWGQRRRMEMPDSAACMCQSICRMLERGKPLFISGISLCRQAEGHHIVDGQQRLTFLRLLLEYLGCKDAITIKYECRNVEKGQDAYLFQETIEIIDEYFHDKGPENIGKILDGIELLKIDIANPDLAAAAFRMINGTKAPMAAADVIKAHLMHLASQEESELSSPIEIEGLRSRYASEWEDWMRWWNRNSVRTYYADCCENESSPLSLLIKLCLRNTDFETPLAHYEFAKAVTDASQAKAFFLKLRHAQKRFEDAYSNPEEYNRIKAVLLLQPAQYRLRFLKDYFADASIDRSHLENYYKLSFLGMDYPHIRDGKSAIAKFDELLATLSMADVYHSEAKREAYNLLLRLNIDEDIKLGRKFDFSIWNNRSLEHIYSKSKVWHLGNDGKPLDGNDNPLPVPLHKLEKDPSFLHRDSIVNLDGARLSEHCIGNLVLLYGENNSAFGNTTFEEKKVMFLTPGAKGAFQSRNLLHSVCVFAGKEWTGQSIVDNYNLTLKNLKIYYGYK